MARRPSRSALAGNWHDARLLHVSGPESMPVRLANGVVHHSPHGQDDDRSQRRCRYNWYIAEIGAMHRKGHQLSRIGAGCGSGRRILGCPRMIHYLNASDSAPDRPADIRGRTIGDRGLDGVLGGREMSQYRDSASRRPRGSVADSRISRLATHRRQYPPAHGVAIAVSGMAGLPESDASPRCDRQCSPAVRKGACFVVHRPESRSTTLEPRLDGSTNHRFRQSRTWRHCGRGARKPKQGVPQSQQGLDSTCRGTLSNVKPLPQPGSVSESRSSAASPLSSK